MISGTKRGDKGGYRNLLQINCQSEWGEGGVGIRIERIR